MQHSTGRLALMKVTSLLNVQRSLAQDQYTVHHLDEGVGEVD